MKRRVTVRISQRREPAQERSRRLVADILEAAIRVLEKGGARGFTSVRVAKAAGVSVGSLYQYFPTKESILFRLQADEWDATWSTLRATLLAPGIPPSRRLRDTVELFFRSEAEEAELRVALADASALMRDAPEAQRLKDRAQADARTFVAEAVPGLSPSRRAFAAEFFLLALTAIAEKCTETRPDARKLAAHVEATSRMLSRFFEDVGREAAAGAAG